MRHVIIALLVLLIPVGALATPIPSIDRLRLGMTSDQVKAVLAASHQTASVTTGACLSDYLAEHRAVVGVGGHGHCTILMARAYERGQLLLFFQEALPEQPGVSVLTTIAVNYPSDAYLSGVITQAGTPTVTDGPVLTWCYGYPCKSSSDALKQTSGLSLGIHLAAGLTVHELKTEHGYQQALWQALKAHGVAVRP